MKFKIALALFMIIILGGCGSSQITAQVVEDDVIKIGAVQPFTGKAAWHAENVRKGVDLAVEEINSKGGISGKRLEVVYEDSMFDKTRALLALRKLIDNDKVSVVIGPTSSSNVMAVAPVAEISQTVVFSTVASAPRIRDAGDFVFRNSISGDVHGKYMAEYAYDVLGARTASTLFLNLANGVDYNDAFVTRFRELGGEVIVQESYDKSVNDFRTQLIKIKSSDSDVVYFAGLSLELAVKQAKELGIESQILAPVIIESQDLLDVAGEAADGILYTAPAFDPESDDMIIGDFVDDFVTRYGDLPERTAADSYDAVMIIALALEVCGQDSICIRDELYGVTDYRGVGGLTTFDEFGDVSKPLAIKMVEKEKFVFV
ncbi:ABC transporter substrate-binding protein [Candidatus Woesearchaeota archaeon]|jgi:branched-chain amino acid transport system substrate-binding protein|nr:ABC transporter substrate-binding protein [Candidatus Woesearchaeota archaeon]MBT3536999.1 ABC transporter substrate-binding protein [Candidatus Woesearchaeota archaeon]MBT4697609.1 ABC transporter substrate-binding protein [Candidatus Woesearchaeota archaeon]MBT4717723.1 ABC transporter substrate-binding protein [Candidatus Woesearchaeota archaeon]MBT7106691.1 ABC transporter substrate-binding protein [Candidatus Woesearchaeota archaeon]